MINQKTITLKRYIPSAVSFCLTFLIVFIARTKVSFPILISDRFLPGAGWGEMVFFSLYAAMITYLFIHSSSKIKIRRNIWVLFSIVFFSKLFIGLAGVREFLMTGKLHLPIPAVIIAGPLFRGQDFFMLILFLTTLVLIGPSWCSFLCYFGCWDNIASRFKKQPNKKRPVLLILRITVFVSVIAVSLLLRFLEVNTMTAVIAAFCFAGVGIILIIFISSRTGIMIHCLAYCPIGFLSNTLGRINPFRIRIKDNCTNCLACSRVCKYNALTKEDIEKRRPGFTCTLCGDCIEACKTDSIHYTFFGNKSKLVKTVFYIMVISCHAVTLTLARI